MLIPIHFYKLQYNHFARFDNHTHLVSSEYIFGITHTYKIKGYLDIG